MRALAKLNISLQEIPEDWPDAMAQRALQRLQELPPVHVAQMCDLLWAFARLGCNPLQGKLVRQIYRLAHHRHVNIGLPLSFCFC